MPERPACAPVQESSLDIHVLTDKLSDIDPTTYFTCRLIPVLADGTVLTVVCGRVVSERSTTAEALADMEQCCRFLRERL